MPLCLHKVLYPTFVVHDIQFYMYEILVVPLHHRYWPHTHVCFAAAVVAGEAAAAIIGASLARVLPFPLVDLKLLG